MIKKEENWFKTRKIHRYQP